MFVLVYVSSATKPFSPDELTALLEQARIRNATLAITGMLLYQDGNFMQALEGDEAVVRGLYARIERDARHGSLYIVFTQSLEERTFPDWSMGFRELVEEDVRSLPGFSNFLHSPLDRRTFTKNPGMALKLLESFAQTTH